MLTRWKAVYLNQKYSNDRGCEKKKNSINERPADD